MDNLEQYSDEAVKLGMQYGPKIILALVTLIVGWVIIKTFVRFFKKAMVRSNVEETLQRFLANFLGILLKALLIISVATMVGIATTSFIAVLGAAGLAVGLALQGSLGNFAGGVLILFFKPYKIGDVIEAQGFLGRVKEIQIFNTILLTLDNQKVIIPNGLMSNGPLKNLFAEPTRRVDLTYGISYGDDVLHAKEVIRKIIEGDERILKEPASELYLSEHAESSINILVRAWVKSEDYWPVHFHMQEQVKLAFDRENITIPFPQRDVHMFHAQAQA